MEVSVCPKPEILAAFARGDLPAGELAAVANHVGTCAACCRALQQIPDDSLAGLARAAAVPETLHPASSQTPATAASPQSALRMPAGFANHPRYRITGELGAGGMGTVYKAEDLFMGRVIALKVVSAHLTARASALARFHKEVRAAAKLEHVNIVRAYDAGEAGGSQFLVMEFVEGMSLDRLVAKKGPLPVPMACAFVRQAALGLQHAADRGMTHRDIKPHNLMVTKKGQVRILDFGLARFATAEEEEAAPVGKLPFGAGKVVPNAAVTNPNLLMGTPDYLSPEQAKNSHDVDPRSDIYSLGCTLYFLLTGKPPFLKAATLIDKLLAHTHDEAPAIREERFEVTEALAAVLAKMMAKAKEDRYQTAKEVADVLLPFTRADAAKEPVFEIVEGVAVPPAPQPVVPTVAPPANTPAPVREVAAELAFDTAPEPNSPTLAEVAKPKKKKAKKRGSWWQRRKWAVVGVAALALLVGVAVAASKKLSGPKETPTDPPPTAKANPKTDPPAGKPEAPKGDKGEKVKPNPWVPPTVIEPTPDEVVILYVIPSNGVWVPDVQEVREHLVVPREGKKRVRVDIGATYGEKSQPAAGPGPRDPIPIDVHITDKMNLSKYSAVVFAGLNVEEYTSETGAGRRAAAHVIKSMQDAGKPVAAICAGQAVLAAHGVLNDRRAAIPPLIAGEAKFQWMFNDAAIKWQKFPVVTDATGPKGKVVITAAGPPQASPFAAAILKAVEGK